MSQRHQATSIITMEETSSYQSSTENITVLHNQERRGSVNSLSSYDTTDSADLLNKHRHHLEEQKRRLERHQNFLNKRKQQQREKEQQKAEFEKHQLTGNNDRLGASPANSRREHSPAPKINSQIPHPEPHPSTIEKRESFQQFSHELKLSKKGSYFLAEKERKLEEQRRTQEILEEEELHHTPQLSERTRKLVERTKRRKSSNSFSTNGDGSFRKSRSGSNRVEDQLMEKEYQRRHSLFIQSEKQYARENPGTPKITPQAAKMVRNGSVTDRLYEMASKIGEKRRNNAIQRRLIEEEELTFEPQMSESDSAVSHSRTLPVHLDLLQRDEQRKLKKLEKLERLMEKERNMHQPKINPVSQEIASRLPSTSRERLLAPSAKHSLNNSQNESFSFRPEICARSREIESEKQASHAERIDKLYQRDRRRREKIEDLRNFYEQKELEECTFAPRTRDAGYLQSNPGASRRESHSRRKSERSSLTFEERAQQWQQKRDSKINMKRRNIEAKEMENCTFRPNITQLAEEEGIIAQLGGGEGISHNRAQQDNRRHNSINPLLDTSSTVSADVQQPSGYTEFIKRQQEARRRKEELKSGVFITGENWKNRVTVPKEFKLGAARHRGSQRTRKHSSNPSNHPNSPSYVQRALHKQIEKLDTSFEKEEQQKKNLNRSHENGHKTTRQSQNGNRNGTKSGDDESHQSATDDELDHIPPQGLFSAGGSLSILQGLNYMYT